MMNGMNRDTNGPSNPDSMLAAEQQHLNADLERAGDASQGQQQPSKKKKKKKKKKPAPQQQNPDMENEDGTPALAINAETPEDEEQRTRQLED